MNYKELWAQARALAFEEPVDMDGPIEGFKGFNQQVYEKFGELIVRECADSLWTEECYNSDLALEEFEKNSKKIRKHFGVEL